MIESTCTVRFQAPGLRSTLLGMALLGLILGSSACQSRGESAPSVVGPVVISPTEAAPEPAPPGRGEADESEDEKPESLEEELDEAKEAQVKADQERTYLETDLELARLSQQADEIEVAESLRAKRAKLKAAQDELAVFEGREQPLKMRKVNLSVERGKNDLLKAETDLANMREIMDEEAEAKNKGEIIRRYEKTFEFEAESLAIEVAERDLAVEAEMPSKLLELAGAVREAEAELQVAEIEAEKTRRSSELDLLKATHDLDEANRALKKAKKKVQELQAKVAEAGAGPGGQG